MAQTTATAPGLTRPAAAEDSQGRVRRWWWLALVAFFLMGSAWAIALPANGTYDEKQHIVRAYGVATGHLLPVGHANDTLGKPYEAFEAPRSLLPVGTSVDCTWWQPRRTANCQQWTSDRTRTLLPSAAGRYSPVYYLPVGIPLVFLPNFTGILLARLVSALMSALLLASAVAAAVRLGNRLVLAGVILVATPLTMNLAGAVNDNGLEITTGVLVFTTLLALVRAPTIGSSIAPEPGPGGLSERSVRRLLLLAGVGILLLLINRHMGPLLLALDVVACLLVARRGRVRELARRSDARWLLGSFAVLGVAFAAGWMLYSRVTDIPPDTQRAVHLTLGAELHQIVTHRIPFYISQMVGQFSYGETTISPAALGAWYLLIVALVIPGLVLARARVRLVAAALVVICLAILVGLELVFVPRLGWYAHGRYVMPTLVGVPLIAAAASGYRRWLAERGWLRWFVTGVAVLVIPLHVYALARVMTRFQVGINAGLDPFGGQWSPLSGPVPPLVADLVGGVLLALLAWRFVDRSSQAPGVPAMEVSTAGAPTH